MGASCYEIDFFTVFVFDHIRYLLYLHKVLISRSELVFDFSRVCVCVCVCVFSSHSLWTSSSLDAPAGVTQEEGHTGFLIHLLSAVRALIFLASTPVQLQPSYNFMSDGDVLNTRTPYSYRKNNNSFTGIGFCLLRFEGCPLRMVLQQGCGISSAQNRGLRDDVRLKSGEHLLMFLML